MTPQEERLSEFSVISNERYDALRKALREAYNALSVAETARERMRAERDDARRELELAQKEKAFLRGAMSAQDEREAEAGAFCGVSYEVHGCDWPNAVAESLIACQRELAEVKAKLEAK